MITFPPRPLCFRLKKSLYSLISRLCGLRSRFGRFQEAGNINPLSEIGPRFLGFPVGGAVPIPAVLFQSVAQSSYRPCCSSRWHSPHTDRAVPVGGAVPIPTVLFQSVAQSQLNRAVPVGGAVPIKQYCFSRWRSPH